jgi:hypothetical protein
MWVLGRLDGQLYVLYWRREASKQISDEAVAVQVGQILKVKTDLMRELIVLKDKRERKSGMT